MEALNADLNKLGEAQELARFNAVRKTAVGTGERSDKRRTYRFQEGKVHDHLTGKSCPIEAVMKKGEFERLWR